MAEWAIISSIGYQSQILALFMLYWRPDMDARRFALLITLCVTLDFASPFVPGAFRFSAEESVDCINAHRQQSRMQAALSSPVPAPVPARAETETVPRLSPPRHEVRALGNWFVELRRGHSPTAATPLVSEDH